MQGVADALGAGDALATRAFLSEHPDALATLMEGSVLDDVLNVPSSRSPSLRTLSTSTGFFNVNPLTGVAEPLLGPGGEQLTGVARAAADQDDLGPLLDDIEEDIRLARENTLRSEDPDAAADAAAQRWGLRDEAHFMELRQERTRGILGDRGAGDGGSGGQEITQDQADYLRSQGWTDEQIAERYTVR